MRHLNNLKFNKSDRSGIYSLHSQNWFDTEQPRYVFFSHRMFPKFLREITGNLPHGRDFGFIPIANEEIATKQGEVLGQSAFASLKTRTSTKKQLRENNNGGRCMNRK